MSTRYPPPGDVVEVLAEVARRAGMDSPASHPEDIACAMASAIEAAAIALLVQHEMKYGVGRH